MLDAARTRVASGDLSLALNDLAKDVGVGTVYRDFRTRRSLVEALVADRLSEMTSRARAAARQPQPVVAFDGFITTRRRIPAVPMSRSSTPSSTPFWPAPSWTATSGMTSPPAN